MGRRLQKVARFVAPYMVVFTKYHLCTYLFTPWSTVLLEDLTDS